MALLEPDLPPERKKKTIWLLAGGAASLLIPLAGAVYLHWSQNAGSSGPTGRSDVFERREGDDRKIVPTQSAVVTAPSALTSPVPSGLVAGAAEKPAESSLDFIKSNADMRARIEGSKAAPAASTAPAAAVAAAAEEPPASAPVAKAKTKPGKKAFTMPKLQPSRGFTNFSSRNRSSSQTAASGGSAQDALKNLPAGAADDPRIQAYLKAHQGQ